MTRGLIRDPEPKRKGISKISCKIRELRTPKKDGGTQVGGVHQSKKIPQGGGPGVEGRI